MKFLRFTVLVLGIAAAGPARAQKPLELGPYGTKASEVMEYIQENFWLKKRDLYATAIDKKDPDFIWGSG